MAIICINGTRHRHETVAEVRACYQASAHYTSTLEWAKRTPIEERIAYGQESYGDSQTPADLIAGMYRLDETIYKVQVAVHGSGHPYAKRLVVDSELVHSGDDGDVYAHHVRFEYERGAIRELRPEHRMTLDEAKEFGALYGTCCVCGRTLTDEQSIENGIGPICAGKYF
jgi:hypothetical protein